MVNSGTNTCSSLPRILTTQIQCSFGTYFWEMYTMEFGWTPAEYGKVSSIYNSTLFFSYITLGVIFFVIDKVLPDNTLVKDTDAGYEVLKLLLNEVTLSSGKAIATVSVKLMMIKMALIISAIAHSPEGKYRRALYDWLGVTCSTTGATCNGLSKSSFVNVLLDMPACESSSISQLIFPLSLSDTLLDHAPKPLPQFTGRLNTPRMNAMKRFMGTRAYTVYKLVVIHGIAMAAFELCTQGVPLIAYDAKETSSQAAWNADNIGQMINTNMLFFTAVNLVIIWIFSWVRYYVHGRARLAETFLLISIVFFVAQFPLLIGFYIGTINWSTSTSSAKHLITGSSETISSASDSSIHNAKDDDIINITGYAKGVDLLLLICLTIFHSTVYFWIFTGGPLTFYVSCHLLNDCNFYRSWGVPAILIGFFFAQTVPGIISLTTATDDGSKRRWYVAAVVNAGVNKVADAASFHGRIAILGISIIIQFCTLLVFTPFNFSWNKSKLLNYMILIMTGVSNTLFLSFTYVCIGLLLGSKTWKMLAYGIIYSIMGLNVSKAMGIMFRSFNADEIRWCELTQRNYHYCFPTVYKGITCLFWFLNSLFFIVAIIVARTSVSGSTKVRPL